MVRADDDGHWRADHQSSMEATQQMSETTLSDVVEAVKALAHPGRLRILAMLREGDLCVCQMTAVLGLAASTVSSHLSDLRRAGFITERKDGKWVHYELVGRGPLSDLVRQVLRLVQDDEQLQKDARVAGALREIPLDTFCSTDFDRKAVRAAANTPARRPRPRTARTRRQA
jgi:ArsR family transcriptional regulator, arsenate/arsenite/antimonite-responsive transcriptional repressor